MWHSELLRRELFDLILTGRTPACARANDKDILYHIPQDHLSSLVCWKTDPSKEQLLPALIIIHDDEVTNFLAAINSGTNGPSPFTAFSRVITTAEARLYSQVRREKGEQKALQGLISLSFAEAIHYAGGRIQPTELTPAICKRTLAYGWAKALANGVPVEHVQNFVDSWLETVSLTNSGARLDLMRQQKGLLTELLHLASHLFYGTHSSNPISSLSEALIEDKPMLTENSWDRLTRDWSQQFSLKEFEASTREERMALFQNSLNRLSANLDLTGYSSALSAFLATQISPSSFEHFSILSSRDRQLAIWYMFMAGLQQPRGLLGFNGGLGSRLLRDVNRIESLLDGPVGDISLRELRVLARAGLEGISKRLGHSNEIEVEVIPLVTCSFRFQPSQAKQVSLFDTTIYDTPQRPSTLDEVQTEKFKRLVSTANELARFFNIDLNSDENSNVAKRSRKKSREY
ncbi:hypothetical protein [Massilia rhizosphaerae]|uniref:hypothetical protein n=1 Tax=Massilia rhizosphaerae TaxID=2784389 RepID=UPI0018DEC7C1|nr:hypothetical protein [Massilia rhizosphaerae]